MKTENFLLGIMALISIILTVKLFLDKTSRKVIIEENKVLRINYLNLEGETKSLKKNNLKFQMTPHTINNIMANLKVIANNLNKGMDSMSETLEYILYQGENHLVSVGDEIDFIQQYLNLNDIFSTEIDSMTVDYRNVDENSEYYNAYCIPHLVSAYFIENAFKHGDKTHPDFLKVKVLLNDSKFELKVTNKIVKTNTEGSNNGGIGLKNMEERLKLLLPNRFEIKNSMGIEAYSVKLIINFDDGRI